MLYYATFGARLDTGATRAPGRHTGGLNVSDQDFFFDEDEKPAANSGAKKGSKSGKAATPAHAPAATVDSQSVSLMVAVLIGVIGILLGVVVGLFIGKGMATPAITAGVTDTGAGSAVSTQSAPQLTQEQIQNGDLPAGHPQVGGSTTPTTGK